MNPKKIMTYLAAAMCLALASCNTVKGFGKDLQQGGEAIEDVADEVGGTDDD